MTGQANRSVDCPACVGLFLQPERLEAAGCAALTQTHTFELWNLTGATGAFTMSYQTGPQVEVTGPISLTTNNGTVTPIDLILTPLFCPADGSVLTATIGVAGNGYEDDSALVKTIADEAWFYRAPATTTQWSAGGAVLNDRLYAMGGEFGEPALDTTGCRVYDPAANSWSGCPSLSSGRWSTVGASDGQAVYVLGGENFTNTVLAGVEALQGGAWLARAPMPAERVRGASAGTGGILYYSGGVDNNSTEANTFWQYTAATDTWKALAPMPDSTSRHAMALFDGNVYVFPGGQDSGVDLQRHQ